MKFLSDILAKAGLVVDGVVTLNSVANATTDTDKFIVIESGVVKYRTGAQVLSDIGAAADSAVVHIAGAEIITGVKTFNAGLSSPSADRSERFGSGATITPGSSLAVAVGYNTSAGHTAVAIGGAASASGQGVALGVQAVALDRNIAIGYAVNAGSWAYSIAMFGSIGAQFAMAIGQGTVSNYFSSIAIGQGAITTAAYQLMLGSATYNLNTYIHGGLTLDSTTQGLLPPRMTNAQRTAITSPATGLLAYSTDSTEGLYLKLSASWARLLTSADSIVTGTTVSAAFKIDYDYSVTGTRNGTNTVFTTTQNFVSGSTRVYLNGIRKTPGVGYDYQETASNQITFNALLAPTTEDLIIIEYLKA